MLPTISNLIEKLNDNIDETNIGDPLFSSSDYETFPLSKDRFHFLDKINPKRRIAYVDGGNQEIIGAPNFSIQLNRVYFNIFKHNSRVIQNQIPHRIEFFSATFSKLRDDAIYYDNLTFPCDDSWREFLPLESDLSFSSMDRTVMVGTMRADIRRISTIARRFAEWSYVSQIARVLDEGDIVVVDGSLQTGFKNEGKYLQQAERSCIDNDVIFTGISKSSSLFTTTGLSLIGAIQKLAKDSGFESCKWSYYPVADGLTLEHSARSFVVKLHEVAKHVFRFEMSKKQLEGMPDTDVLGIISTLAANSSDTSFPGYPYGLIEADFSARVTAEEAAVQRIVVLSEISKRGLWEKFARHMQASDAHDVLNSLKSGGSIM